MPGAIYDPAAGQDLKAVRGDAADDLGFDPVAVVPGEHALEPGVAPHLGEPGRRRSGPVHTGAAPGVVRHVGRHHHDGDEQPEGVDHPQRLGPQDLLAGTKPLVDAVTVGGVTSVERPACLGCRWGPWRSRKPTWGRS